MSGTENFLGRWSRLKDEAERAPEVSPTDPHEAAPTAELETPVALDEATPVEGQLAGKAEEAFDPASLPSIDSIDMGTDVRGFLQPRVPPELTRAALRRAWASDPAIRDFIGIAENQWDFNDPTAIPGFGPMRATDNVPALLAQALGKLEDVAEKIVAAHPAPMMKQDEGANVRRDLPVTEIVQEAGGDATAIAVADANERVATIDETPLPPRQHGGALPQ